MNACFKKLLVLPVLILAVCLSLVALPGTAKAETLSGACGTVSWSLDDSAGTLTLSSGTLADDLEGWIAESERYQVKSVVFEGDVVAGSSTADMFRKFSGLTSLDLSKLDTSNTTNMANMFNRCSDLTSVNLSGLNTSNVENMTYLFRKCKSLQSIDLSSFDTAKVTKMAHMFNECSSLTNLTLSSNFSTANVDNMYSMFKDCSSLTSLDLSSFTITSGTETSEMLSGCTGLNTMTFGSGFLVNLYFNFTFPTPSYTASGSASSGAWGLASETATTTYTAAELAEYGETPGSLAGTWYAQAYDESADTEGTCGTVKWVLHGGTGQLEVFGGTLDDDLAGWVPSNLRSYVKSVVFSGKVTAGTNLHNPNGLGMFKDFTNITTLDLTQLDVSNAETISYTFMGCTKLESINLSTFNTSNATELWQTFDGCSSLKSLDLSSFDTSKVKSLYGTFNGCSSLTSINLSSFDTSHVGYFMDLFNGCSSLTGLDLSSFNSASATSRSGMFEGCSNLNAITFGPNFAISADAGMPTPATTASGAKSTGKWGLASESAATSYTAAELMGYGATLGNLAGTWYAQADSAAGGDSDAGSVDKGDTTTTTVTKTTTQAKAAAGATTPQTGDTSGFVVGLLAVLAAVALVSSGLAFRKR